MYCYFTCLKQFLEHLRFHLKHNMLSLKRTCITVNSFQLTHRKTTRHTVTEFSFNEFFFFFSSFFIVPLYRFTYSNDCPCASHVCRVLYIRRYHTETILRFFINFMLFTTKFYTI